MKRVPLAALHEREFRLFFSGQLISLLGDAVTPFALAWAILDIGTRADLGYVLAAKTIPLVGFLLVGGVFADRLPRRAVMVTADLARLGTQGATPRCCSRTTRRSGRLRCCRRSRARRPRSSTPRRRD